uniref:Uncharacterized protein n=1 Tax=Cajanus cajan TaxID=3821 RepID=A0A151RKU9_CAJCA|nr:hypothetical protein KK1_035492 [Cajanus cajan]
MILRGQHHYSSLYEATSSSSSDEEEILESEEETYSCEGDLLMVRRLLGNQSSDLDQSQRENLIHTRCKVLENTCSLIVDSGASHILLGRPWQFDKKTIHDGLTNKISFHHLGKKIVLCPLSPFQVSEDQLKMKVKREDEEKKGENKRKKKKTFP